MAAKGPLGQRTPGYSAEQVFAPLMSEPAWHVIAVFGTDDYGSRGRAAA